MEAEFPELTRLRAEAERLVGEGRWKLRLMTHVALGGIGAVGILARGGAELVVLRFWEIEADRETMQGLAAGERAGVKPTIRELFVESRPEQARAFISSLGAVSVPMLPPSGEVQTDGVLYEVYVEGLQHSTTMRWVGTAPTGWETVSVWFGAAWSGLSQSVQGKGAEENS